SYTAQSGIRTNQYIDGSYNLPPVKDMLDAYNPQIVIIMLGTNDASANRPAAQVSADLETIIAHVLWREGRPARTYRGAIPVLSTIPPKKDDLQDVQAYNAAIAALARKYKLPLIDFYGEIMKRRPNDWLGTLISGDGVHPSAGNAAADPYANNGEALRNSGLLLRCFLTVQKVKEIAVKALNLPFTG
ncbi:MAG TPA: SGNH/GDSL hydrolase family protein, partial [Planctomycetes bacterium]|nr:SGNH/GDSL hydrolase family protein [Planctomycetota bacterium]